MPDSGNLFHFSIDIPYPCSLLLWILTLFAGGMITTLIFQMLAALFFYYTQDKEIKTVSIVRDLQLWRSYSSHKAMINALTEKTKALIFWSLRIDFIFMFFAYGLMITLVLLILQCRPMSEGWMHGWKMMRFLPFIIWALDIGENNFTKTSLTSMTSKSAYAQLIFSILKWFFVFVYLFVLILFFMNE